MGLQVMIVGAGRVGSALAVELADAGHQVTVLEQRADRRDWLAAERQDIEVVLGDGVDPHVLEAQGARRCDVLVAVTDLDDTNVLIATIGKIEFGVPRTITRIVDPRCGWLHIPAMGVDVAMAQASLIARLVAEEVSHGNSS
jgi:trk system potassium uptake protein TrkA